MTDKAHGVTESPLSVTSNAHTDADRSGGGLLDVAALDVAKTIEGEIHMKEMKVRNPAGLYETMRRRADCYDIRQAKAKKRRRFGYDALKLDDLLKDENGDERENAALGDDGRGAEAIIEQVSAALGDVEPSDADVVAWQDEFGKVVAGLDDRDFAILEALKTDWTDRGAAKCVGGICHMTVHRFKTKLRGLLVPAHLAWKRRH